MDKDEMKEAQTDAERKKNGKERRTGVERPCSWNVKVVAEEKNELLLEFNIHQLGA